MRLQLALNVNDLDAGYDALIPFDEVLDASQIATISSGDFSDFVIPEPSAFALFGLAGLALILRRRR